MAGKQVDGNVPSEAFGSGEAFFSSGIPAMPEIDSKERAMVLTPKKIREWILHHCKLLFYGGSAAISLSYIFEWIFGASVAWNFMFWLGATSLLLAMFTPMDNEDADLEDFECVYGEMYHIRYKGKVSKDLFTFDECCRFMRLIPPTESMEVLLEDGRVHFTLPPRNG